MICSHCNKSFLSKKALIYHGNHNVCMKSPNVCGICGKQFTSNTALTYHMAHKVCFSQEKEQPQKKIKLTLKCNHQHYTTEELLQKVSQLEGKLATLSENPQTINNNQISQISQINNQINIIVPPAFLTLDNGQTLMKHMPNLLHNALSKHPSNFISYLIKETNCNPNLPLYNSIKITNKREPYAQISDGEKYIYASKKSIITQLIENKRHILQEYVDNHGDKYGEKILKRYQNYVDFLDDEKEALKELEVDIICMLLNVSDLIGSEDWSKKLLEDLKIWEKQI